MQSTNIKFDNLPSSISEFFTPGQFAEISEYEKQHLSNLRQNFEALRRLGFPVTPPEFMLRNRSEKERRKLVTPAVIESSDGSDSEWTPALEKPKRPSVNQRKRFFEPPKKASSKDNTQDKVPGPTKWKKQRKKQTDSDEEEEVHVYPFRKKRMSSYMSLATLDDDDFLYCEVCIQEYHGDCPVHGPLLCIDDTEVQLTDPTESDEYSKRTLPKGLVIKNSKIPNAGLGVFAEKDFPSRARFGPYRGKKEINETIAHESGYSWQIVKDGQTSHFVDGEDSSISNWMRYVNCARHEDEQCVTAYQYQGEIYYRSHKPIFAGTEILVYYGDSYAKGLGIQRPKFVRKVQRPNDLHKSDVNMDICVNQRKRLLVPPKKASSKDNTKDKVPGPTKRKKQRKKQTDSDDENEEEEVHVYPFRKKRLSSYMSLATLDDDDFLCCEECRQEYDGDCPVHGPLLCIDDTEVQLTDPTESDEYSKRTLPKGLVIKNSKIPNAGLGVFAEKDFPSRARFGPYRGKKEVSEIIALESGYSWQIVKDGQTSHFVDGEDSSISNWMRYVNCARHEDEQCVTAYQYQGEIYYRSHKPIFAGTEILVYYGDSYAKDLGIQRPKFGKKAQRTNDLQKSDVNTDNCGIFSCAHCSLSFHQSWCLQRHMKYRHHNKYLELNYDKLHPDLSLGVSGLTKVHIKHEQHDVNILLNDTDMKPTATTQSESIKTCVSTVSVDEAKTACNFSSQHDCTINNNDRHCISKTCTNLATSDQSDIEGIIVKSSSNEDPGEKYNNFDVNSEGFHKTYLQKDRATLTGEKTNNPNNIFTVDVTKISGVQTHKRIHTGEKPYKCDVCNVSFTQSSHLKRHKRIHTGEKPYKCDVCNVGFTQNSHLKRHKIIHTGEKPYKCNVCNIGFTQIGNLKTHKRIHTGEKPYKCDVFNIGFTQSGDIKMQKRIYTEEKPYKCDVCNVGFTRRGDLKMHKRIHTGEKPYKCDVCNIGFTRCDLKMHKRIHTGEKPYKCDVCNVGFTRRCDLKMHKRIHTGEKPYKCDVCNVGFTRCGDLKMHKRIHTGEKPYKCDVCNVGFSQSGHLKRHKRMHTGEKPYKCDVCNVGFHERGNLKRHKRIHTGENPYKCDVCNVSFSENCSLKRHKRIHTGEKPYKCDVCDVGFIESGNLKKHKRIHTGEKPYKCDVCNVSFTRSGDVKRHKRIHTGEKPYKCNVCIVGFTYSGDLKRHKRRHTGEKPYKCDVCNVGFTRSGHLKSHKRIHKGENT